MKKLVLISILGLIIFASSCKDKVNSVTTVAIQRTFGTNINFDNLENYANQSKPNYITKDNTSSNGIQDKKATLGRVLFYDKSLSIDNTIACASCHHQSLAFGDTAIRSKGVQGGLTGRHSMRLVNNRFSQESKYFWDERAASLEIQSTKPIQDFNEMGYSNTNGRPDLSTLITKLSALDYYQELFQLVYSDNVISEARLQECLSQFVRSIQSFDSKYDQGRQQVGNDAVPFPNFTTLENEGKNIFLAPPIFDATGNRTSGGFGCQGCHRAPEFDIDPLSRNNGIVGNLSGPGIDITNTKSPSLRDLVNADGKLIALGMHTGVFSTINTVIGHYGNINLAQGNTNLDPRLLPGGNPQKLNITAQEVNAIIAFLKTLKGSDVYSNKKWSNPFI